MKYVIPYTRSMLMQHTNVRAHETKLGEAISFLGENQVSECSQTFVLIGIPEDIGVRANHGVAGTSGAWKAFLDVFCNMQHNAILPLKNIMVLGEIDCTTEMKAADLIQTDHSDYYEKLGELVRQIDEKVSHVIHTVVKAGKIPIIIGGGHNNSYGNLKGLSTATDTPVNCINFDAHSDFRTLEHRHSGNGFSYAMNDGFLNQYFVYGLHKAYVSREMMERMDAVSDRLEIAWFDELNTAKITEITAIQNKAEQFVTGQPFGLEIDLDAIASMGSSAISPIGFSVQEAIQFVKKFAANRQCGYIHLCEGAPNRELHKNQVGKTLAYLVTTILSTN